MADAAAANCRVELEDALSVCALQVLVGREVQADDLEVIAAKDKDKAHELKCLMPDVLTISV